MDDNMHGWVQVGWMDARMDDNMDDNMDGWVQVGWDDGIIYCRHHLIPHVSRH